MEEKTKLNIKIALVILLLGPLIFLGVCFPAGLGGLMLAIGAIHGFELFGTILFYGGAEIIGLCLAIFICYKVIKKLKNKTPEQTNSDISQESLGKDNSNK